MALNIGPNALNIEINLFILKYNQNSRQKQQETKNSNHFSKTQKKHAERTQKIQNRFYLHIAGEDRMSAH